VLDKAVLVLQTTSRSPMTLADLVDATGLPRATAHRLAAALENASPADAGYRWPLAARPGTA